MLEPPVRWQGETSVSRWGIAMTLAYVPFLGLWYPLFAAFPALKAIPYDPAHHASPALYANIPYLLCAGLNPLLTALTAGLVFRIGRRLGLDRAWAVLAGLAFGVASPAAAYARYDFPQPLATLALAGTVWHLLRADGAPSWRPLVWAGAGLGLGLLTRSECLALAPWIVGWVAVRSSRAGWGAATRRALIVSAPIAAAIGLHLVTNWLRFGNPAETGYPWPSWPAGGLRLELLEGLAGLLLSPGKGLLVFFPLAWLALPGFARLVRAERSAGLLLVGLTGILLAVYAATVLWQPRGDPPGWWAGTTWGPRYLQPVLPLLALAAARWAAGSDGRRQTFLALGALGLVISWNGILFDFVSHYRWLHGTLGLPWTGETEFRLTASPLVSGWSSPARSWDLFWLLDPNLVRPLGQLAAQARSDLGLDLGGASRLWGLTIPALLLGVLVGAASRIRTRLRVS